MVLNQEELNKHLLDSIELFEGKLDIIQRREYILAVFFYKRLCDQFDEDREHVLGDPEDEDSYGIFIPKGAHWNDIRKVSEGIGEAINNAFDELEEPNEPLKGILKLTDFNDPKILPDQVLSKIISHFSREKYKLNNSNLKELIIIGKMFRYIIKHFAEIEGKKASYTPEEVIDVLVRVLNPEGRLRICDPACGSGGMLIGCANYYEAKNKDVRNLTLFGQEKNRTVWSIAKMNLLFHNLLDAKIKLGDTFKEPILDEKGQLRKYGIILANPIWNDPEWDKDYFSKGDPYNRLIFGIPPKSDWCWVQHMLTTLEEGGRAGIVLDNGALFRGGKEGKIRKAIVKENLIEGIIALPDKLFYKGSGPGCLIIFNKKKPDNLEDKIFFIHAGNEFEEGKAINYLLGKHIEKISNTYLEKKVIPKFSDLINIEEIEENDFNLNVSRYVDILPEEEPIDLDQCLDEIIELLDKRSDLEQKWKDDMKTLGFSHFDK